MPKRKRRPPSKQTGSNSKSGYFGVVKNINGNKFQAKIWIKGKWKVLGSYDTAKQAAKAHDEEAIKLRRPFSKLNFPKKAPVGYTPIQQPLHSTNTVGYRGAYKIGKKFHSRIWINGKKINLGTYVTAKEAATAYDRAVLKNNKSKTKLNFPDMVHNLDVEPINQRINITKNKRKKKKVVAIKKKIKKPYRKGNSKGVSKGIQTKTESSTSQALQALAALATEKAASNKGKGSKFPKIRD